MACVNRSNSNNFLRWNKVVGNLTLAELQANGMPLACDNISVDVPLNLTISEIGADYLTLTWDSNSQNIDVYKSSDGVAYSLLTSLTNAEQTYSDTGLSSGTYHYKVRSVGYINSAFSNVVTATTLYDFYAALQPDGVNDWMQVNGINAEAFEDFIAFSFWIHFPADIVGENQLFTAYIGASSTNFITIRIDEVTATTARIRLEIYDNSGIQLAVSSGEFTTMNLPDWNLFNFQMKPTGNPNEYGLSSGVNGVVITNNAISTFSDSLQSTFGDCTFFTNVAKNARWCEFPIDQFSCIINQDIFTDLATIWNNGFGIDLYNLYDPSKYKFHYSFDSGVPDGNNTGLAAPEINDETGNGFTATLNGFAKNGTISNFVPSIP
jgi:hypothetical protein